jgi:hypothetical protein
MLSTGTLAPAIVLPSTHANAVAPSGDVVRTVDGPAVYAGDDDTVCLGPEP